MAREINLVPDVKGEMIRALKLRNFIFFLCIVVAAASVGVTLFFFSIAAGQDAVVNGKKETLDEMSKKISDYSDLSDFLTIRDQLGNLSSISENKKQVSRLFGVLSAILPTGADTITISTLNLNFEEEEPTITIEAQANAGKDPFIDYNVLDSFKKSMQYMRYDYGNYVDKNGDTIPAYCIVETGADGATLKDSAKGRYAFWTITKEGCAPELDEEDKDKDVFTATGYEAEEYDSNPVVRIWRTPQYNDWHNKEDPEKSYITLDGAISGVPHFESNCISYSGTENGSTINWSESNEECKLVPDGTDGINILESSNGRDASEELVLRFTATITLSSDVFSFQNKHLISLGPTTRYNVTDSYVQVQNMFKQKAHDCAPTDISCKENSNGGNN